MLSLYNCFGYVTLTNFKKWVDQFIIYIFSFLAVAAVSIKLGNSLCCVQISDFKLIRSRGGEVYNFILCIFQKFIHHKQWNLTESLVISSNLMTVLVSVGLNCTYWMLLQHLAYIFIKAANLAAKLSPYLINTAR